MIQSWDTAYKLGTENDYTNASTWPTDNNMEMTMRHSFHPLENGDLAFRMLMHAYAIAS
ncbi:hypothetical protein ACPOL_3386 [Acidisarcina polymorpha]|uniref:Uncharacterized protein n=1 Tax=Acidisarcina polymorpha TaxID=2211140 RepID=A0A2Z5G201_9BACT|nr:hypothetical protein ACPOL_3386 [Acidisarcina polymorpha]